MKDLKLLIVEDKQEEQAIAIKSAKERGFREIAIASNLEEGLGHVPSVQAVVTDLFFPAGNVDVDEYIQRILPLYIKDQAYSRGIIRGAPQIREAIMKVCEVLKITPQEYIAHLAQDKSNHGFILENVRASFPEYEKRFNIKEFLGDEENLPLGVLITEEAQKYGIPSVIVTSASDHDKLLRPLTSWRGGIIQVPYFDKIVEGHKDWKGGLLKLIEAWDTQEY